jgi:tetratricopeptide (TPR) repeat protein
MKHCAPYCLILYFALTPALTLGSSAATQASLTQDQSTDSDAEPKPRPRQTPEERADLLSVRKEYEAAADAYLDLIKTDPHNARILNKLGVVYESQGDYPSAERYFKQAIKADPKSGTPWNNLGTLDYSYERYSKAIKSYKKALERTDTKAIVYSNLAYAYSANRQIPQALDAFAKAVAIDPDIYTRRGAGGSLVEQRSSTDPATLFFLLAKTFAQKGDVERTVQYLKLARDSGYKKIAAEVKKDPSFATVIADRRVKQVLEPASVLEPVPAGNPGQTPPVSN